MAYETNKERQRRLMAEANAFDLDTDPLTFDPTKFDPRKPLGGRSITHADDIAALDPVNIRAQYGYNPTDLSEGGFAKTSEAFTRAYADGASGHMVKATQRNYVFMDYAAAAKQFYNLKQEAGNREAQTRRVQQQQRDAQRKQQEGAEEGSKPKGKATVLTGSNIPVKARRTSSATPTAKAGRVARFKSPGVNI